MSLLVAVAAHHLARLGAVASDVALLAAVAAAAITATTALRAVSRKVTG